jgi:hypothetical protein
MPAAAAAAQVRRGRGTLADTMVEEMIPVLLWIGCEGK